MERIVSRISHPSQPDFDSGLFEMGTFPDMAVSSLAERFEGSGEDLSELVAAGEGLTRWISSYRHGYERAAIGALDLSEHDHEIYGQLAGNPDTLPEAIDWFRGKSAAYFQNPKRFPAEHRPLQKIGMELLGGIVQYGDIEAVSELDQQITSIPHCIQRVGLGMQIMQRPGQRMINYRYQAMQHGAYGTVRRRRAVANVIGAQRLYVFKEALAMVVESQLPPEERKLIDDDVEANPKQNSFDGRGKNNTTAANTAGRVFKRAIEIERGTSRQIIPLEAHYVLIAKMQPDQAA